MMSGWERSPGARKEFAYAVDRGIKILFQEMGEMENGIKS